MASTTPPRDGWTLPDGRVLRVDPCRRHWYLLDDLSIPYGHANWLWQATLTTAGTLPSPLRS